MLEMCQKIWYEWFTLKGKIFTRLERFVNKFTTEDDYSDDHNNRSG